MVYELKPSRWVKAEGTDALDQKWAQATVGVAGFECVFAGGKDIQQLLAANHGKLTLVR
jgi:hypothetical protein